MTLSRSTYRAVGKTGLSLPALGFGSAHLGELYRTVAESDALATLDAAWAAGIRFYDTAPWYGRGLSEHRIGGFLRAKPRQNFLISTKVGRTLSRPEDPKTFDRAPWVGGLNFAVQFDYSYDGIMRAYEQSLQRLALDTVDALFLHDLDPMFHGTATDDHLRRFAEGGMRAMQEIKASGQIKAIGVGVNLTEMLEPMVSRFDFDVALVAMPYTLLDQSSLHDGMAACLRRGTSVIIGAPFASGILVTGSGSGAKYAYGEASPEIQARVRGLESVCKAHGVSLPAAALQFPMAHPAVVSIIPGAAGPSELVANVAALEQVIPAAFWADVKAQGLIHPDAPVPARA